MRIQDAVSAFITAEPETSLPKKTLTILVPRATIGITAVLAVAAVTADGHGPLPRQLAQTLIAQADGYDRIDLQTAINFGVILYVGENILMSIMEKLMKPLIVSGEARGEARAQEKFEAWKEDQRRRGAVFFDDEDQDEDGDESSSG